MFDNLRWRLSITYLLIIILVMALSGFFLNTSVTNYYLNNAKINYMSQANILANSIAENYFKGQAPPRSVIKNFGEQIDARVLLLDYNGKIIMDSFDTNEFEGIIFKHNEVVSALKGEGKAGVRYLEDDGWVMYIVVPVIAYREVKGAVFLSTSVNTVINEIRTLRWQYFLVSILIGVVVTIISIIVAKYLTGPIKALTAAAKKMAKGDLSARVEITGQGEIRHLAQAFNIMGIELENYNRRQKSFVANASHELRTPLSSIKALVESLIEDRKSDISLYKEFLKDINTEIDRLSQLVENLLNLARLDKIKDLNKKEIDVMKLANNITGRLRPLADEKNIKLSTRGRIKGKLKIDAEKLYHIIWNLADNAIKYTPNGGKVYISLIEEKERLIIRVRDTGIGIPEGEIENIFEPFVRIDKARCRESGGFGLGLSLVKEIVETQNGEIKVKSRQDKGSVFTIILPIEPKLKDPNLGGL
ncbi:MAG TPA: cell wall metabolism sensor histidine kinase WalK [Thermoanaerobacterales bacterium]|nr:cell wall metabolism sensor histidine kinase WalK [Thermoanaerobacterales bacterium]